MSTICAYIIAIESIAERVSAANNLIVSLKPEAIFDDISVHPAIYWRKKSSLVDYLTKFPEHTFTESYLNDCVVGQIAATLSHISAWRRLLESDHDAAIVFEDDIYVTDKTRFAETVSCLRQDSEIEWARLHLHKAFRDKVTARGDRALLIDDPTPWGFATYYVNRSGAEKLLAFSQDICHPVDWFPRLMSRRNGLRSKAVTRVIVDHHDFEGDEADLEGRHELEKMSDRLQKTPSAIYTSPRLTENADLHRFLSKLNNINELKRDGVTVLRGTFDKDTIKNARNVVLDNRKLFKNTRPTPSSGHVAGFHRFPAFEPLHNLISGNSAIRSIIDFALNGEDVCSIGLSDITINRSQNWHIDLLRGKYQHHLDGCPIWEADGGGVYKIILYLNDTDSLKVVIGSHLKPLPLDNDLQAEPGEDAAVLPIAVYAGDVVIMDLRCCHRGADEAAYATGKWDNNPRILMSTVLGGTERKLTRAMEIGNFIRLSDWMDRHP